ncbi:MAG: cytochrome c biosis protein CcmG, thiol:disulfide interchange protein DsbE [Methylobacteriaceae bacterium]|nr:cytochrome c biosis protein CcmG, thiol:disulfide interchange protein DsbE [Methylobacteriaceae bacterium]
MSTTASERPRRTSRWLMFLPLIAFVAIAALFLIRLYAGDASLLPSALIGRPVPRFDLPPLPGVAAPGLSDSDLRQGRVTLVNVFASWCVPCHAEHSVLMEIARDPQLKDRVALVGLAYKDEPENTRRFLGQGGNPFARIGVDASGRAGIDFGVYGVPETYVIRGDGTIAYRFVGPLSNELLRQVLLPQILAASR